MRGHGRLLTYRPAIDGLRALAVLAVIVFHMVPGALPGGWYGVDTFFVISGFLITSLLLAEYRARRGRIDLLGFWMARCRRLLPALFAVLLVVLGVSPFLSAPGRISSVGGDVLGTLAYVANWRFILGDEAYFGDIAAPSPLRHAWSLGVEEQFYIVYPLLLMGLLAIVRRRVVLAGILGLLALVSAGLMGALHHPGLEPTRVYYGTDTRAHQLLVGALAAVLVSGGPGALARHTVDRLDTWCRRLAPFALVVLLSAYWWAGSAQSALLEGWLLPLSIPVAIILVTATSPDSSVVQRVLSVEPLRLVGVISYGLYLWHWPVVVFLNDTVLGGPAALRVSAQAALTVVLAILSYRFIERPVRRGGLKALVPRLPRLGVVIAVATVPVLVSGALLLHFVGPQVAEASAPKHDAHVRQPEYTPASSITQAAFIGNSVPDGLAGEFDSEDYPDLDLMNLTNPGCTAFDAPGVVDGEVADEAGDCAQWRDSWGPEIKKGDPDLVVLFVGQNWVTDRKVDGEVVTFGSPEWTRYIESTLDDVQRDAGGRRLAVVNLACHEMPTFGKEDLERINDVDHVRELNDTVSTWAKKQRVSVIDQYSLLCSGDTFRESINGEPLYEDSLHFTPSSADIFWRWLAPQLQRAAEGRPTAPSSSGGGSGR